MASSLLPAYRNPLIAGSCLQSSAVPAQLVFTTQPGGAIVNTVFTQQPVVEVRDSGGDVILSFTGNVTIAIWNGGGALAGTMTVAAVAGVATFTNLQINTTAGLVQLSPSCAGISAGLFLSDYFLNDIPGTYAIRLQTHIGDNVPLGLFKDTACTIPATQDGDLVKGWKGELMGVPVTATQSDSAKAPTLFFVDGVPTVLFDGVDDILVTGWTPTIGSGDMSMFSAARLDSISGVGKNVIFGNLENGGTFDGFYLATTQTNGFPRSAWRVGGSEKAVTDASSALDDWNTLSAVRASGTGELWVNGASIGTVDASGDIDGSLFSIADARSGGGAEYWSGPMTAVLVAASAISSGNRIIIQNYLATLNP